MKFVKSRYKKFTELASQQKIINEVEFSFDKMVELLGTYIDKANCSRNETTKVR